MTRHTRLSAGAVLHQRQVAMAEPCDVPACTRPRAVRTYAPSGLAHMSRWCNIHRYARRRPVTTQTHVRGLPIPDDVKVYPCTIPGCTRHAQMARTAHDIDGTLTPGWWVRPFCNFHRPLEKRPVGWLPHDRRTPRAWRWYFQRFLGVTRWGDRGHYDGQCYRLTVGRLLHRVPTDAIVALRIEQEKPWTDRMMLGAFAARYNLAVVAVVGATHALLEFEGHGKA